MALANSFSPALAAFLAKLTSELTLAEVRVRRREAGFELRHRADAAVADAALNLVSVIALRELANHTAAGEYRPLKATPNLRGGWRCVARSEAELELALQHLYPGALADWFAAQQPAPPVTSYRDFTTRQTGMYRITTMLDDAQATRVTLAGCDAALCLKRRLWTVPGLAPDEAAAKSIIPCLEPCAVLLESARKAVRLIQAAEQATASTAPSE